ncbi:hypothetical protein Tco_0781350 [Tanacetum coccineum]
MSFFDVTCCASSVRGSRAKPTPLCVFTIDDVAFECERANESLDLTLITLPLYLNRRSKLGLWYPRDSPFDLEAFSDSDYAGASLDMKSTTGAEYVAATNCCGRVLWIQNQMLDYEFNFMNTNIYIDNESTNCIMKNLVFHSKTKQVEIRHHFIRDYYEKRLIQVIKIHIDHNVADLLTKAFDVSSISDEFGVKTGGCKVNAARQDLVLLGEINDVKQIHATFDGKTVVISESSVRSDLHFNDEDGLTCLTNDAIFENLALMGYESNSNKLTFQKALFSPQCDAETQGRNTAEQITTAGDTVNTTSIDVNAVGPSNVLFSEHNTKNNLCMIRDVEEEPRRATPVPTIQIQDKGKGKMVEPEPTLKNPIKTQIQMDAEIAQKLFEEEQAQFERDSKGLLGKKLQNKRPRMLH